MIFSTVLIFYVIGTITFNATIADTCKDSDCTDACCSNNAKKQGVSYLTDIEYYTVLRYFGSYNNLPAKISFVIN